MKVGISGIFINQEWFLISNSFEIITLAFTNVKV